MNWFCVFCIFLHAQVCAHKNFENNSCITKAIHKKIAPFLLPLDHPLRPELDTLFSEYGVNQSILSLQKAGFTIVSIRPYSYIVVVRHPRLPGHLLKLYLDSEVRRKKERAGWRWLVNRCEGAQNIRNLIREKNLTSFTVPDKWIYPLPPRPPQIGCGQTLVLLVTDMNIVNDTESKAVWKNSIPHHVLDELYILLSNGFASSYLSWNIPYSRDGTFACIDTEHPKQKPNFKQAREYLSHEMAEYWDWIIRQHELKTL